MYCSPMLTISEIASRVVILLVIIHALQTAARGFLARLEAKRRQAIMLAILEAEEARRRDALAVIAPYARLFADRSHFLAMR